MQVPALGRTVLYRFPEYEAHGAERPATIVRVWGDQAESAVNLQVLVDGSNDGFNAGTVWKTSVTRGFGANQYHFHDDPQPEA